MSEEEIEEIREAFNLFDTDGSGMRARTVFAGCISLRTELAF